MTTSGDLNLETEPVSVFWVKCIVFNGKTRICEWENLLLEFQVVQLLEKSVVMTLIFNVDNVWKTVLCGKGLSLETSSHEHLKKNNNKKNK